MNICVVSPYPFPYGLAASNRIVAYTKGLVANGATVKVYLPFPSELPNKSNSGNTNSGQFEDIYYCYTSGKFKSQFRWLRGIAIYSGYRKIKGYITSILQINIDNRKKHITHIIISFDSILYLLIYASLGHLIKAKILFIFDEYPTPIRHKLKIKIPKYKQFLYRHVLKMTDGYISISDNLKSFYNNLCPKRTFILSSITNFKHFDISESKYSIRLKERYICYMGNMELTKDNVDLIIKAFSLIYSKYPDLYLYLYGAPNHKTYKYLQSIIEQFKLETKILIKGQIHYNDVPSILKQALILVSSQPNTMRAFGGFPTKLAEYMATGIPVVLTDVGENSKYIKNNVHVFFVKPNDIVEYATKLEYILDNYADSLKVAQNGRKLIKDNFSAEIKGYELLTFLSNLI